MQDAYPTIRIQQCGPLLYRFRKQTKQHKLQETPSSNVSYKKYPEDLTAFISTPNRKNALKCMLPASSFPIDY